MKISLFGYMGSGKSSIGNLLAERLNLQFIDLDQLIEKKQNLSIKEIFANGGEIKFRKIERETLLEVLTEQENFVLALGGGTPAYYNNTELLVENSKSVYLRLNPGELIQRLLPEKNHRPLIAHLDEEQFPEFIAKHLFERRHFYEKAELSIDVQNKSPKEITEEIIQYLQVK